MLPHLLGTRVLYPGRKGLPCEPAPRDGSGEGLPGNILISELSLRNFLSLRKLFKKCLVTLPLEQVSVVGGKKFLTPVFFSVVWCVTGCLMHMIWGGVGGGG